MTANVFAPRAFKSFHLNQSPPAVRLDRARRNSRHLRDFLVEYQSVHPSKYSKCELCCPLMPRTRDLSRLGEMPFISKLCAKLMGCTSGTKHAYQIRKMSQDNGKEHTRRPTSALSRCPDMIRRPAMELAGQHNQNGRAPCSATTQNELAGA